MSNYNISSAVYSLQAEIATLNEKITALRFLKQNLTDDIVIDSYNRKRINQLILDSILKIILSEDKVTDARKTQLVRTELFVILASLLNSNVLFGSILSNPDIVANERLGTLRLLESNVSTDSITELRHSHSPQFSLPHDDNSQLDRLHTAPHKSGTGSRMKLSSSEKVLHNMYMPESAVLLSKTQSTVHLPVHNTADSVVDSAVKLKLLRPSIVKHSRKLLSRVLKPRPSVLFSDKLEFDSFVPGADPHNFIEQDRKLGYQKPRMWFPGASVSVDSSLLPADRVLTQTDKSAADRVVEEFLQMRALASYVGDLVLPQSAATARNKADKDNSNGVTVSRLAGLTDPRQFSDAMSEAVAIWSPLLGVHLPRGMQNTSVSHHRADPQPFNYSQQFQNMREQEESVSSAVTGTDTYASSDALSLDESFPPVLESPTKKKVSRKRKAMFDEEESSFEQMARYQTDMGEELAQQRDSVAQSLRATERLITATIKAQYALLPSNYIVLLEGAKANARTLIANTFFIFCRVKRRNLLALAMGVWKICLVETASLANRPKYAKTASIYLMARWAVRVKMKNLQSWLHCWRTSVTVLIFNQRTASAVVFQKSYRRWRDRRKFVQMHLASTYNGMLSDIYLAPNRPAVAFTIPDSIRSTRRMLWLAAIIIQTVYRCWIESRAYLYKRRQVLLLQSIFRMYPKFCRYRRLKAATIRCQAWARRTVKRNQFKRLKRATIIVQKYVRRYLSVLRVARITNLLWRASEQQLAAIIRIQCRWRIFRAKKRTYSFQFRLKMRQYSALVIQRNYYRHKKAFHTFFLMCVLRVREAEDAKLERLAWTMGRRQCARRIQRYYKERYFKRNITAVVRVQCWFRGRQGYNMVDILRRQRWATRKLHHWARGMVYRRHRLVRKIQRWWWRLKKGRLLRHLWHKMACMDRQESWLMSEKKYFAAGRIQAYVKGSWDRRWVRRHRAAIKIQRNYRFFAGLRRWKNWKRERILKGVRRFVSLQLERATKKRVKALMAKHDRMIAKPQALIRGFVVRSIFARIRAYSYRLGLAAVLIQRFWRKTGAMSRAVEEVMALRRMDSNPFRDCLTLHEVLLTMRRQCRSYYSLFDPRVGLRISSMLFRLGCADLTDMFPRKDFLHISDLQGITMERLLVMHSTWLALKLKLRAQSKKKPDEDDQDKRKRPKPPPVAIFQTILDIVNPPLFTRKKSELSQIQQLLGVPEYLSPNRMMDFCKKSFLKKFGKHLLSRAQNVGREIVELVWSSHNNYRAFGHWVVTSAQVGKAIGNATDATHVLSSLEEIRTKPVSGAEDVKWDRERLAKCADLLQLAVDQAQNVLPPGTLLSLVKRAVARVASHRRKMTFLSSKLKSTVNKSASLSHKNVVAKPTDKSHSQHKQDSTLESRQVVADSAVIRLNPLESFNELLSIGDSVDLPFCGTTEEELELELNVGVCKLYLEALDRLHQVSSSIQSLKNSWNNSAMKRAVQAEKLKVFLSSVTQKYIAEQQTDNVKQTWNKIRKAELAAQKYKVCLKTARDRKVAVEAELQYLPLYGWESYEDEFGYTYWFDALASTHNSVYDMPTYSFEQWLRALRIQQLARRYLVVAVERRRLREELKQMEMAEAKAKLDEEIRRGSKLVNITLSVHSAVLKAADAKPKRNKSVPVPHILPTVEDLLPWKYRFEDQPTFTSGVWALMKQQSAGDSPDSAEMYDIVMVFKIRAAKGLCDVRTVKGTRVRNVNMKMLRLMHFDIGTAVEARYKNRKLFYRAVVSRIDDSSSSHTLFNVQYEDGEREAGLSRDLVRPTAAAVKEFLSARQRLLPNLIRQHRRMVHFAALKAERIAASTAVLTASVTERVDNIVSSSSVVSAEEAREEGTEADDDDSRTVQSGKSQGTELSRRRDSVGSEKDSAQLTAPAEESEQDEDKAVAENPTHFSADSGSHSAKQRRIYVRFKISYSKYPLRQGWVERKDRSSGATIFVNTGTAEGETTWEKPIYSAEQAYLASKLQSCWLLHKARKLMRRKVLSMSIGDLIKQTVDKCAKIAFVGFGMEGVTTLQLLRRMGYWELADAIEQFYKASKMQIGTLTVNEIAETAKENLETIGVMQTSHIRDVKELQTWWRKTTPQEREKKLALLNYHADPYDHRTLKQCIVDSEEVLAKKFLRVLKTSASRTKAAVKTVAEESLFPHSHLQIENYLKRYADKPEMARDSVFELINKQTTHTWVEERQVLALFRSTTRVVAAILDNLHMTKLHKIVRAAERRVDGMMKLVPGTNDKRPMASGFEAKAAFILRRDVFHFLACYINAAVIIQRRVRSFYLARVWKTYLNARVKSVNAIQRAVRRCLAFKVARNLREQQTSEWEQLWDFKRRLMYYYNYVSSYSTYEEPQVPFRPLVRDPKSAVLIQAWPHLGGSLGVADNSPNGSALVSRSTLCAICKTRKCVRVCYDCTEDGSAVDENRSSSVPYCFPCFLKEHTEERQKAGHNFDVAADSERVQLMCSVCEEEPATRKCQGPLSDARIDLICADLRVTEPDKWQAVLQKADVAGDRKLSLLLDQVRSGDAKKTISTAQLQEVRSLLERTRAECDECYCAACYADVHSGGKRATHRWLGFRTNATVCAVCTNSPAETNCLECDSPYCESCFKVFHGMGRKRRHKKERLVEELVSNQVFCGFCQRRAGTVHCANDRCDINACDSCYECTHKVKCDHDTAILAQRAHAAKNAAQGQLYFCIVCADPADKVCAQCGDFYCSKTWMGNPGCFVAYHNKGNRASHTAQAINYGKKK